MANPVIQIRTSKGDITAELFEDKVPNTVANIVSLAENGFYDGLSFHRIIPDFMVQGGCPYSREGAAGTPGTGGPDYQVADECTEELRHDKAGILSMANAGPDTNGSQFFICLTETPWLDGKHTVFGQVTDGVEILKELEAAGTPSGEPKERVDFNIVIMSKEDHEYVPRTL